MARRFVQATGIFDGLRIPESYRGSFVLFTDGKLTDAGPSAATLIREAGKHDGPALLVGVPRDERAIAAY